MLSNYAFLLKRTKYSIFLSSRNFSLTTHIDPYHTSFTDVSAGKTVWKAMNITLPSDLSAGDAHSEAFNHLGSLRDDNPSLVVDQPIWCQFEGITCGTIPGTAGYNSVEAISIHNLGLTGSIPWSIGDFQSLTSFDISDNSLTGSIPSSVGNLSKLKFLSLMQNSLIGTIPPQLSSLVILTSLDLSSNFLTSGVAQSVPLSTFANATLYGFLNISANCLSVRGLHQSQSASPTHCSPNTMPASCKCYS